MEGVVELRSPEVNADVEDAVEAGGLQTRSTSRNHYAGPAIVPRLTKGDNGREGAAEKRSQEVDTDVEDAAEDDGLQARSKRNHYAGPAIVPRLTKGDNGDEEPSENTAYLHENGGALEDLDFLHKIPNSGKYDEINYGTTSASSEEGGGSSLRSEITDQEEIVEEEEVVELEFEKAIPKLHTHTMHCPSCDSQITKVVLRRKIIRPRPQPQPQLQPQPPPIEEPEDPLHLMGCVTCLRLFTCSGNPFALFWTKRRLNAVPQPDGNGQKIASSDNENCFSIIRGVFQRGSKVPTEGITKPGLVDPPSPSPDKDTKYDPTKHLGGRRDPMLEINEPNVPTEDITKPSLVDSPSPSPTTDTKYDASKPLGGRHEPPLDIKGPKVPTEGVTKPDLVNSPSPSPAQDPNHVSRKPHVGRPEPPLYIIPKNPETNIIIPPDTIPPAIGAQTQEPIGHDSTSFEILKSVVYGGLMEVIASLSVVASAVAADATTLTVVALALANLIGGIFVISHNLWDLKDDYYKFLSQETNQVTRNKYKELLGHVVHFPMHVFFAILSFIMFGIVPPVVYGYSFHETNDKDFTIVVVASASLVCVGLLAILKAYVNRCIGFLGYIKIIAYYLTTTIAVSGVSYAVGNLVTRLIKDLGLFEATPGVAMSFLPETNPSLAYY